MELWDKNKTPEQMLEDAGYVEVCINYDGDTDWVLVDNIGD